ncbi:MULTISPECIES: dihydrolipoyl dehydrogenase [Aneurinibacillus]|uniref:Dihydrolipoyl dehydrogenase n=1 Tax=Aneurinibacillus thermoaerophilus TaxID=143495 RepID=A0A1G8D100_ANETH|nr:MULTISPECIES: dihydrolipoyl dehydrogenase [Aneurinibacillus]AMA72290.1 dihydrolipoamide dehydrogenase [Aneurinibacillus sp. XH2]MED0674860.1 dihydrolipoyl dehydrogenase [Aneurinibacillus thermoaerophilus]MED0679810.1 dihydrolipoyl dehydrogenase [Aneurinibacillus thermoaerophilus]MED0735842.1 dihydrolipoyl dehydrogenase [Aneurinibacillus thermoaerophilus]MED0758488.1 dihydrolipoyl dehydrogenase [Aneurinibacillus thermoaerophilus]
MVVGEFTTELDVLVIGAGPGGYVAAIRAAQLGKKVAIVDKAEVGGVCLNRGCIPSKSLISAAKQYEQAKEASNIGINVEGVSVDMKKVQEWKQGVVKKLTGGVQTLLKGNGVEIIPGEALFVSENEVRVFHGYDVNRYRFNHCIIATGSRPIEIPALPFGERILSSTEALELDHIPEKLLVVGGGYIGIELGTVFAKLGSKVTVLEGMSNILPGFEKQMVQMVRKKLKKLGVEIHTEAMATKSEVTENGVKVTANIKDKEEVFEADYCLVTVGRRPNTDELGLEAINMKLTDRGLIEVDKQCRTNVPNIYAIGDVVAGPALAHKASYEGKVAAEVIAGLPSEIDYMAIPAVVFSDPEMASVGLTEEQAKEEGYKVKTGRFSFAANGRALSVNEADGFVKVVANEEDGRVLGVQIVGPEASDLIAEAGLAIEMGATLEDIALTIHAHPTLSEVTMEAAEAALGHGIHSLSK